jgi:biopolymer transport protein ExbD/biopolymer transport protein TolR
MAVNASSNDDLKAEINVTPLVDVVLVLLIVFMVVTPLLKQEVPIELPIADNSRGAEDASQVTVSVAADGRTLINGVEVPGGDLVARLGAMYADRPDKTIFLEADRSLPHGRIVDVMDDFREAGIARIGVITRRETAAAAPPATAAVPEVPSIAAAPHPAAAAAAPAPAPAPVPAR